MKKAVVDRYEKVKNTWQRTANETKQKFKTY